MMILILFVKSTCFFRIQLEQHINILLKSMDNMILENKEVQRLLEFPINMYDAYKDIDQQKLDSKHKVSIVSEYMMMAYII